MLWFIIQKSFFQEIKIEYYISILFFQHLIERSWYAVTETCLAFTVFRDDFSPKFVALFTLLLFLKCFHWLAEDRIDYVSHMYFWKKKIFKLFKISVFNETCIRIRINQSKHVPVLRIQLYSFASYCCHWSVYLPVYNFLCWCHSYLDGEKSSDISIISHQGIE